MIAAKASDAKVRSTPQARIGREAAWIFFGRAAAGLAGFASVRILTSVMSPDLYGRYALLLTWVSLCNALLISPVAQGMNRFVHDAAATGAIRDFLVRGIGATTLLAILCAGASVFLAPSYVGLTRAEFAVVGAVGAILIFGNLRDREQGLFNTYRWRGRYVVLSTADAWLRPAVVAGMIALFGASLSVAAIGQAAISVAIAMIGAPWLVELSREGQGRGKKKFDTAAMVSFTLPLFLINILGWVNTSSDRYILSVFGGGPAEVGRYVASCQIASIGSALIASTFFPIVSPVLYAQMAEHPDKPLYLDKYLIAVAVLSSATMGGVVVETDTVSRVLLSNSEFLTGDAVVPWVGAGLVLNAMQQVSDHQALFSKRTWGMVVAGASSAIVSVSVNLLFLRRWGIMAAGVAQFLAFAVGLVASVVIYRPRIGNGSWGKALATIAWCALAVVIVRQLVPGGVWAPARAAARWMLYLTLISAGAGLWLWRDPEFFRFFKRLVKRKA